MTKLKGLLLTEGFHGMISQVEGLAKALGLDFMFELMGDGLVEYLAKKIKAKNIPFGIGGVARMDEGMLQGSIIIKEHIRLGSSMVILSRTFKRDLDINKDIIKKEVLKLNNIENEAKKLSSEELEQNHLMLKKLAKDIADI